MADKQSRLVFSAPPTGGSAIDTYRAMVYEGSALIETVTGQSPLLVTHAESVGRVAVLQAHNAQGWSTPVEVVIPATTPATGGSGGGTTDPDDPPGIGNSSGAVPAGTYQAPSGLTASPLDQGLLVDVASNGSGYNSMFLTFSSAADPSNVQTIQIVEKYLWPQIIFGLPNDSLASVQVKVEQDDIGTVQETPTATGTPHAPKIQVTYDASASTLTISEVTPGSGTYDSLLLGYAKSTDTQPTYVRNAVLPITVAVVPGDYNFAAYALIRDKPVNYDFISYTVPDSGGSEVG